MATVFQDLQVVTLQLMAACRETGAVERLEFQNGQLPQHADLEIIKQTKNTLLNELLTDVQRLQCFYVGLFSVRLNCACIRSKLTSGILKWNYSIERKGQIFKENKQW